MFKIKDDTVRRYSQAKFDAVHAMALLMGLRIPRNSIELISFMVPDSLTYDEVYTTILEYGKLKKEGKLFV